MGERRQSDTLVARAIVGYEIERGGGQILTVPLVAKRYKLEWGLYHDHRDHASPRAHQLLRNELNRAVDDGRLRRLPDRDGPWIRYEPTGD